MYQIYCECVSYHWRTGHCSSVLYLIKTLNYIKACLHERFVGYLSAVNLTAVNAN